MKKCWLRTWMIGWVIAILLWCMASLLLILGMALHGDTFHEKCIALMISVLIISLIVIVYLGKTYIIAPIHQIIRKIELFNTGISYDEIFDGLHGISGVTDVMFQKIKLLLDKERMIENAKQQARYLALQNQINPHFLYNVLESMRSDALIAGVPEIGNIAEALAVFFRYTTSKMENLSTLQEELGNVENYFLIQKYRFEDKIELIIHYPMDNDDILKTAIPKLTLQPIVENAIKHGLEPKVEGGKVEIDMEYSKRYVYISIRDDGVGIDEEKLKRLNERLLQMDIGTESQAEHGKGGIALLNVNTRIRLLMGEEYGLHIFSTPGIGTEIRLTIPYGIETFKEESKNETGSTQI